MGAVGLPEGGWLLPLAGWTAFPRGLVGLAGLSVGLPDWGLWLYLMI